MHVYVCVCVCVCVCAQDIARAATPPQHGPCLRPARELLRNWHAEQRLRGNEDLENAARARARGAPRVTRAHAPPHAPPHRGGAGVSRRWSSPSASELRAPHVHASPPHVRTPPTRSNSTHTRAHRHPPPTHTHTSHARRAAAHIFQDDGGRRDGTAAPHASALKP
jgi:hypothetical protein